MQALVREYLDERRRLGFALAIARSQLFVRFADQSGQLLHHRERGSRRNTTRGCYGLVPE